jgi:hypothetical protein
MFILEGPYVSELLKETIVKQQIPILESKYAKSLIKDEDGIFLAPEEIFEFLSLVNNPMIYSNSENAYRWIYQYMKNTNMARQIDVLKNKVKFRELFRHAYPGFYFREVEYGNLDQLDVSPLPYPFIIKPSVGFFSLGVYKVNSPADWPLIRQKIKTEVENIKSLYPKEVLDVSSFIIEENIEGTEYAFDAYFDENGEPVILGLLEHTFANGDDVTDRVYISSKEIIEAHIENFTEFLRTLGNLTGLKNFPLHSEVRVNDQGNIIPIEINPMRFGGWCTTADFTYFAFGFNPYVYLYSGKKPNWQEILKDKAGKTYANIVLTNSSGIAAKDIKSFDYEGLKQRFSNPLELRATDYKKYLNFGFLFTETDNSDLSEIDWILRTDLKEFISQY